MRLFFDSSAFIARGLKRDRNYDRSMRVFQKLGEGALPYSQFYTSDYVMNETVTFILHTGWRWRHWKEFAHQGS